MIRHILVLCSFVTGIHAVTVGQIDTFEDGSTMNWFVPGAHPFPPANIITGGPAGVNDNFLMLTATGSPGAGGRLAVLNESQWQGNYLALGITHIAMDLRNFGPQDLHLRLLFEDFPAAPNLPPDDLALSADAIMIPANSDWMRVLFPVTPSALASGGLGSISGALMNVDTIRIFHNPLPEFGGPNAGPPLVNAVLGVDNIMAVPEPSTWLCGLMGIAALLAARKLRAG